MSKTKLGTQFLTKNTSLKRSLQIEEEKLLKTKNPQERKLIEVNIRNLQSGIEGETVIEKELNYSGLDLYVLPDIHLEHDNIKAQIDFVIVARKKIYLVESKHLYGNLEIKKDGTFVKSYKYNGDLVEEALYSPVRQCERHENVILSMNKETEKKGLLKFFSKEQDLPIYHSIIVIANPKTILKSDENAPEEITNMTIRADNLVSYIKEQERLSKRTPADDDSMFLSAKFFLENNKNKTQPLTITESPNSTLSSNELIKEKRVCKLCGGEMRLIKGKIGPFYGCSNYSSKNCRYTEAIEIKEEPKEMIKKEIPTIAIEKTLAYYEENEVKCPKCGSPLLIRHSKKEDAKNKVFVGCSTFPKCKFSIFDLK